MKNRLVALGLTAGLAGGLAGSLVLSPGVAVGQSSTPSSPADERTSADERVRRTRSGHFAEALAPLIADGTITQAQADKVMAALQAARAGKGPGSHRGQHKVRVALETVAARLGLTEAALRTALESGQSIADVARSKNVPVQSVIDALVADAKSRLAAKVSARDITQAEADTRLAKLTERFTEIVNSTPPKLFGRERRNNRVRPDTTEPAAATRGSSPA
ncbi:MAG TPA: hypothetical protein VNB94_11930 [Mycobacteriales bacterium]|nr:hypothetical protein [Mycobacteriales bacterium]